ncbi:MAG TPA: transglycosylase SLT domain-containing protein, partial [Pyrinomonadaceae bacterium]|nr:transglycosylase SLT domain-containing protein [Pyrinomonadaceae bacterium]
KKAGLILGIIAIGTGIGSVLTAGASKGMIIQNITEGSSKSSGGNFGLTASILAGVGSISNFAQQDDKKKKKKTKTPLSLEVVIDIISRNNRARDDGADDAIVLCQAYKESHFIPNAQIGSKRGLLQIGVAGAYEAGWGNGKTRLKDKTANPDFFSDKLFEPNQNIWTSTKYLSIRIQRAGGDVKAGLNGYGTGDGYADNILSCADLVRAGNIQGGLDTIYPPPK